MKCPHCLVSVYVEWSVVDLRQDRGYSWSASRAQCPACHKMIVQHVKIAPNDASQSAFIIRPKGISRAPLSSDVPDQYAQDYKNACLILSDSPKASAAFSRRCLQNILRDIAKVRPSNLSEEIDEILNSKQLPSHLAGAIDAMRGLGNFSTHRMKSTNTGEIGEVEEGESEKLLDVLEELFDFYFVQPSNLHKERSLVDKKLQDAEKRPLE